MNIFSKLICGYFILLVFYSFSLQAQQYVQPPIQYPAPPQYSTPSQYYYNLNNPYSNSTNYQPYGFYGGFYGSPPPPTPSQAFPDKAAADNLYRYIQSR